MGLIVEQARQVEIPLDSMSRIDTSPGVIRVHIESFVPSYDVPSPQVRFDVFHALQQSRREVRHPGH